MIRIYAIVAAVSAFAIVIGLVMFARDQREIGGAAQREQQEKENAQFRVKAAKGRIDYDTCDLAGGLYQFGTGTCKLP